MILRNQLGLVVLAASGALWALPADAQSFCDLVPASEVKAALGVAGNLVGKPTREGGNGCAYSTGEANVPNVVDANASDYVGIIKTIADTRFASPSPNEERITGLGEAAMYTSDTYSHRQSIFFRAKGKYVNLYVSAGGAKGVPKAAILSLAALVISKPINSLKDPPS
jgi:hypothetical protein